MTTPPAQQMPVRAVEEEQDMDPNQTSKWLRQTLSDAEQLEETYLKHLKKLEESRSQTSEKQSRGK